jgi:hypothetical protein
MKKLITETERNQIIKMNSLNENWFSDILDTVKKSDTFQDMKKKFEELTGVDFDEKEESGEVTQEYKNYKITEPSYEDKKMYKKILEKLDAPVTKENLVFLYAWRQAEGAKATYNPFNTTQSFEGSTFWNCLKKEGDNCKGGVRNYKTEEDGIDATVKTLTNGRYECIVNGLKKNKGAKEIAKCSSLDTWGTKEGITKVLNKNGINPPEISKTLVKKV